MATVSIDTSLCCVRRYVSMLALGVRRWTARCRYIGNREYIHRSDNKEDEDRNQETKCRPGKRNAAAIVARGLTVCFAAKEVYRKSRHDGFI